MKSAIALVLAVFLVSAPRAEAASFSYDLNCPFGGTPTQPVCGGFDYGQITFTDGAAGTVNVTVDLSNSAWTIGEIDWNISSALDLTYNDPDLSDTESFNDGNPLNDVTADGYSAGLFDIGLLPPPGPPYPEPYTFSVTGTGLTASMFNVLDSNSLVYAAVHIQACGADTVNCQAGSRWVGAGSDGSDGSDGTDSETPVPEPGSLILLGSGLAFAANRFRQRKAR